MCKLSKGNSKLPKIPNYSVAPVKGCPSGIPCAKQCYAMKAYRQYPSTRKAWDHNLQERRADPLSHQHKISHEIQKTKPEYFRIHVAGDFQGQIDLEMWNNVARENPETKFLAFTKNRELSYINTPSNLQVVASQWPKRRVFNATTRKCKAWYQDGTETRIPDSAVECPGKCDTCKMCWTMDHDVIFNAH